MDQKKAASPEHFTPWEHAAGRTEQGDPHHRTCCHSRERVVGGPDKGTAASLRPLVGREQEPRSTQQGPQELTQLICAKMTASVPFLGLFRTLTKMITAPLSLLRRGVRSAISCSIQRQHRTRASETASLSCSSHLVTCISRLSRQAQHPHHPE